MTGWRNYVGGRFKWGHLAWSVLAVGFSLFLIVGGRGGHPPAILLLPLVLIVWVIGHVLLCGVAWLAVKGRGTDAVARRWPTGIIFALIASGVIGAHGILQVVVTLTLGDWYPFNQVTLWGVGLAVSAAHAAAFIGLLLRRNWAATTAAGLCLGWAVLIGRQIMDHVSKGYQIDLVEFALALVSIAVLIALALHLSRSRQVKAFLKAR